MATDVRYEPEGRDLDLVSRVVNYFDLKIPREDR
jgi:hypothetical protein